MLLQLILAALVILVVKEIISRRKLFAIRDDLGLSGPPVNFLLGNLNYFLNVIKTEGLAATVFIYPNLIKQFGDTFGLYMGKELEIVTIDRDIIQDVFISQFSNFVARKRVQINCVYPIQDSLLQVDKDGTMGAGWKEIRSVVSNVFTSGKMKKMHTMFHDQLEDLMVAMRQKAAANDGCVEIYGEYQAMTMDMIARVALGQQISCIKERDNTYYREARSFFSKITFNSSLVFRISMFFPPVRHLRPYSEFGRHEDKIVRELSEHVVDRQRQRAAGNIRPMPDLIDLILDENEKRAANGDAPLHHDVVVSNLWALILAGYETTSTALAFTSYLLGKYPEVQDTLLNEITETFGDEPIDYDRVMKLPYLHAVFCEALRLSPPVLTFTGRRCIRDTVVAGGIKVPAGVNVTVPVHALMWSEANFDQPDKFIPERFLGESKASWSTSFMPFGLGPRNCVGARFAEMEYKTVLAEVTRNFRTEIHPDHPELVRMTANVLNAPLGNKLFVRLIPRK